MAYTEKNDVEVKLEMATDRKIECEEGAGDNNEDNETCLNERTDRIPYFKKYKGPGMAWSGWTEADSTEPPAPAHVPLDTVWQHVAGTKFKFLVYSAYTERRTVAAIRIIAATHRLRPDPVVCRLWLPNNRSLILKARVKAIRDHWSLKYSAAFVVCLLRKSGVKPEETVGASVSVVSAGNVDKPPTNILPVLDTEPKPGTEETLHVCVKPFHFSYSRVDWLLEWMEMNRLLGVSHFYMYNQSLSAAAGCMLQHYASQGLVTLLPWRLPMVADDVEMRNVGQFSAFNDCLYRSMSSAGWLIEIDEDELVFPRRERTLTGLLTTLQSSYNLSHTPKAPSAYLFRNAFFYTRWEDDPEAKAPLTTALKTRRWVTPHMLKVRSKFAVRPRDAVELGVHFLWEMAPGAREVGVATDRALLHHYRVNCEDGSNCLTVRSTIDRTAHRWTDELLQRYNKEKQYLDANCPSS